MWSVSCILGIPNFWANIHLSVNAYHVCSLVGGLVLGSPGGTGMVHTIVPHVKLQTFSASWVLFLAAPLGELMLILLVDCEQSVF